MTQTKNLKLIFKENKLNLLLGFLIFFLSILFTYNYTDFSANMSVGSGHAFTAKSLALSGNFNVDEYWGNAGVDIIKVKSGFYTAYAPLNATVMAPFYLFGYKLIGFISRQGVIFTQYQVTVLESLFLAFSSSIALITIFYILTILNKTNNKLIPVYLTVGTLLFGYSVSYFNHIYSALLILLITVFFNTKTKTGYLFAGLVTSISFLNEFPTILISISFGLSQFYNLYRNNINLNTFVKNILIYSLPVLFGIIIMLFFNLIHFNNPFLFSEFILKEQKQIQNVGVHGFSNNPIFGLYGLYFSPLKGLFIYSPFLVLSLLGVKKFINTNYSQAILVLGYFLIISFIYAGWNDCYGATAYGPRYLISTIPLFIYLFNNVNYTKNRYYVIVLNTLGAISIFVFLLNSYIGIADYKMGKCQNLNSYSPYQRIYKNYFINSPKTAPILLKEIKKNIFD